MLESLFPGFYPPDERRAPKVSSAGFVRCRRCGRKLTNPKSMADGIGRVCGGKLMAELPRLRRLALEAAGQMKLEDFLSKEEMGLKTSSL